MSENTSSNLPDYEKVTTTSVLHVWDTSGSTGKWVPQSKKEDITEVFRTNPEDY